MSQYLQLIISSFEQNQQEILIAALMESEFEGIEESETVLLAYIKENDFDEMKLKGLQNSFHFDYKIKSIPDQNWNALWESNFDPVIVSDFVAIRAHFHKRIADVKHEIVITPKMSFGTGHHATTFMMVQQMRSLDFQNKSVFDFGTGTGILAILAEKMGATSILAIDNDAWSIENAMENTKTNLCKYIKIEKADKINEDNRFDIILANINKNVIIDNLKALASIMKADAILLLSGLLAADEHEVKQVASKFGLYQTNKAERNNWICLQYQREN
ncbi:MAG: 50S ribosomal protein L11 methyltransferase [Chitinophagaceae bacterium]